MDHQTFESKVAERAGVPPDQAQALIRATLQTLAERITGGEAHDLAAQLPKQMKEWLEKDPGAPAESFGLEEFIRRSATALTCRQNRRGRAPERSSRSCTRPSAAVSSGTSCLSCRANLPSSLRPNHRNGGKHVGNTTRRDGLARGLGWVSLALGVPPTLAPGGFSKALGIGDAPRHRAATIFVGVRELAAAAGLLSTTSPVWLWARVGGDVMDLGMLGRALKNHDGRGAGRTAAALAAVAGITGVDVYAAATRSRSTSDTKLTAATTVMKSPQEAYDLWRRLDNLPDFMAHLDDVRSTGPRSSHWRATAPFGRTVEWDAEITADVPGERLAWRSLDGADIQNEGEVRFVPAPGDRGTEVHVKLRFTVPGGKLGETVARYFGEHPGQQLDDDLRRFKQVAETGEVVRSEGAPGGKWARREFPQHPARPLADNEKAMVS
jgi:uncharacterized membrane protein